MDRPTLLLLGFAGALALYLASSSAQASASPDSGSLSDPPGPAGGSVWDWLPSFGGTHDADGSTSPSVDTLDTTPLPGVDFGLFSNVGEAIMGWKVGEYPKYASAIRDAESRYGIPTDLLARLLYQESRYRPDVIAGYKRSPVGALGIAQFMPATAAELGLQLVPFTYNGQETQTYDPFASIDAAGKYLRSLNRQLNDWKNALVAYNWGIGNVQHWLHGDTYVKNGLEVSYALPPETRNYVAQISADVQVA